MRILPEILLITAGLSLGFFIASGLVALVIGLGIVTRYAGITKTAESLRFYECCCMAGALFGDLFSLGTFSFSLPPCRELQTAVRASVRSGGRGSKTG